MIETARSIQSFPSTRAYSTSFSAGKYSGRGIGSAHWKIEKKFNLLFFDILGNSHQLCLSSPPDAVVVAKLYDTVALPASFFAEIFSWYQLAVLKSQNTRVSLLPSVFDVSDDTTVHRTSPSDLYSIEKCEMEHPPLFHEDNNMFRQVLLTFRKSFSSGAWGVFPFVHTLISSDACPSPTLLWAEIFRM